jgi:hypothetical protein
VSPPTEAEQDQSLARLTGSEAASGIDPDLLRLRLISDARQAGIPWAMIGMSLGGMSGKEAKANAKRLARVVSRRLAVTALAEG